MEPVFAMLVDPRGPWRVPCYRWLRAAFVDGRLIDKNDCDQWVLRALKFMRRLRCSKSDKARMRLAKEIPDLDAAHALWVAP